MKSIFHVTATSAEDLRREVVAWHRDQQRRAESNLRSHKRPNQATIVAFNAEICCHRISAQFWEDVHIDQPPPEARPWTTEQMTAFQTTLDETSPHPPKGKRDED